MSWYQSSFAWILKQRDENPDLDQEQLEKHCRKNYPYAMRRGWAYKAWLRAMKDYFTVGKTVDKRKGRVASPRVENDDQEELFDE